MYPDKILNNDLGFEDKVFENNFFKYLAKQKKLVAIAIVLSVVIFITLKFCFPIPDFFLDSYSYVYDAVNKRVVAYRPLGYSHFLRLVHGVAVNANVIVLIQYVLFFTSTLFCFFSCDYLYGFPKKLKSVTFYLAILNPILILQTNLISSDSLFCSFTVTWFTFCLWIIKKPTISALVMQVIFLLLCFHVRYTAIFYPLITIVVFCLSKGRLLYKIAGIMLSVSVIYFYVERQKSITEKVVNVRVFSGFSGWQIANNVLCYYDKINVNTEDLPTEDTKIIDHIVKNFFYGTNTENYVGTQYLWRENSPLKHYLVLRLKYTGGGYFSQWCWASQSMSDYGWAIIRQDPIAYIRHFMFPNFKNFMFPDPEILSNYNNFKSGVPAETRQWFGFNFDQLFCRFPGLQKSIIILYPAISFMLNLANILIVFVFSFRYLKIRKKIDKDSGNLFFFWCFFYFGYMAFCLFSTIVLLRYLDPLFTIGMIMPFALLQQIKNSGAFTRIPLKSDAQYGKSEIS